MLKYTVMEEENDGTGMGMGSGGEEGVVETPEASEGEEQSPEFFLKDWTADDVYQRISDAGEFPDRLNALESRVFGSQGPIKEQLGKLAEAMGKRVSVNTDALKALDDYDPKLREALETILPNLIDVSPIDETTLQPYLSPIQQQMQEQLGAEIVKSQYSADDINAIVPPTDENGVFQPQGQRHKDFMNWYAKQGFETRQALTTLGSSYVHALRSFERWEQDQIKEREKKAADAENRLNGGQPPRTPGTRSSSSGLNTEVDGFNAIFNQKG